MPQRSALSALNVIVFVFIPRRWYVIIRANRPAEDAPAHKCRYESNGMFPGSIVCDICNASSADSYSNCQPHPTFEHRGVGENSLSHRSTNHEMETGMSRIPSRPRVASAQVSSR